MRSVEPQCRPTPAAARGSLRRRSGPAIVPSPGSARCWRAAALAARCCCNATDLFFDEAQYWAWSLEPAFGYYSKPPLIAWMIALSTSVCGDERSSASACPRRSCTRRRRRVVFLLGRRLYDARDRASGRRSPSRRCPASRCRPGIISTDVPLLLCWAVALVGFVGADATAQALAAGAACSARRSASASTPSTPWRISSLCAGASISLVTPERRGVCATAGCGRRSALGVLLIAPNLALEHVEQLRHVLAHGRQRQLGRRAASIPSRRSSSSARQFGVFGPILFGACLVIAVARLEAAAARRPTACCWRSPLPILGIVTVAGVDLPRACQLGGAGLCRRRPCSSPASWCGTASWRWLKASLALNGAVAAAIAIVLALADVIPLPPPSPLERVLGWKALGSVTRRRCRSPQGGAALRRGAANDRAITATLLYYLRDEPVPVKAWRERPSRATISS